jgi:hypothetical protein
MAAVTLVTATIRTFWCHLVAVASAIIRSIQYSANLNIRSSEWKRYLTKSVSFALCYAAFGATRRWRESWRAGEAAFLCCAYDVVTDWRMFAREDRLIFETILNERVSDPNVRQLALDLYVKEHRGELTSDGLERGPIALRFTLQLMQCERAREHDWPNVDELGELLQIVDDVLDYEDDLESGDINCLRSDRRTLHLQRLRTKLADSEVRKLFRDDGPILTGVIKTAISKAGKMLGEPVQVG